jgi:hypothetical protein
MGQVTHDFGGGVTGRVLATTYAGRFDSAGVLRLDDIETGSVERFDTYDPKQGGTGFGVARMLATVGLTLDDVDWKLMPNRDMADFIANRGVEGAVLLEPFYTLSAQRTPLLLWGRLADYYPGMQIGAFAFGERFALERPFALST